MTNFKKLLLAGTASAALIAGPAFANEIDAGMGAGIDAGGAAAGAQVEGTVDQAPAGDPEAALKALGYSDIEPVEAEGDAAAEGTLHFNATNVDGDRVTVEFDANSQTVIGEEPAY